MEAAAADLLAALSSPCSCAGLHSRFASYLHPFSPHLNPNNPRPPTPDEAAVRPLAKRFLPFLSRALHLLPPLLRQNPRSPAAEELLDIYGLVLDCLDAILPCLDGKPYSVLLQRGRFVWYLESRGHYARAEAEAAATLDALRRALSPTPTTTSAAASLLPEPAGVAGEDPDITTLAVELTVCLANCASKGKVKEAAPYERLIVLVQQLRPWLRILTEESSRKYLTLLVNALSRCAESPFLSANLLHKFCLAVFETAGEYVSHVMVIFDNARSAVALWSNMGTLHHCSPGVIFQQPLETLVPLLCSLVDLLAMKGCFELQFELCKLIIMIWKQENLPLEKLFSMLFINGRLNHACCHLPMDQKFVSYVAQHLGVDCHSTIFWRNCFKEDHPSLTMFLQRLWPVDFFSQSCEHSFGN